MYGLEEVKQPPKPLDEETLWGNNVMSFATIGGFCFKHGAYGGYNTQCPKWPECADPNIPDLEVEEVQRAKVCAIARTWIGTPYHHMGRVRQAGADCAMFPLEVYRAAGIVGEVQVPFYPVDWHLHRSDEVYLSVLQQYAREVLQPKHGEFVLYHYGRCWSHGAIVIKWPLVIHAVMRQGVVLADGVNEGELVGRQRRFFRPLKWAD